MNKRSIYISGVLITLLFGACSNSESQITKKIDSMEKPASSYTQTAKEEVKKIETKEIEDQNSDLKERLLNRQYYVTLKDQDDNINQFSWKFTEDGISSTKLNGYSTTTLIPYQINENILSMSIDDRTKVFTFEAEDSDYLIFQDDDEDIRFYSSAEKAKTFFTNLQEDNPTVIEDEPKVKIEDESKEKIEDEPEVKFDFAKLLDTRTFFLPAEKDGKKVLFQLDFEDDMVTINALEGYELAMSISYYVEGNNLKFKSESRTFDSDKGDYLLFTDNSRMYRDVSKAKSYLDSL